MVERKIVVKCGGDGFSLENEIYFETFDVLRYMQVVKLIAMQYLQN